MGTQVQCPACRQTFTAAAEMRVMPAAELAPTAEGPMEPAEHVEGDRPLQLSLDEEGVPPRVVGLPPRPLRFVPLPGEGDRAPGWRERPRGPGEPQPWGPEGSQLRRDCEPHRAGFILTLGVVSLVTLVLLCPLIGLPCGLAAWWLGQTDLQQMRLRQMDPEGLEKTQAGQMCGIIGTLLNGLVLLGLAFGLLAYL